ncbi:hypothetical protein T440DRAFT_392489 [Plenodomus tracheiphilus IPT5]|uniref:Uncharacterized protein n=1 Tax=Plenodomus tracheiphilus IPT5 TaxID=1408161 RepID=A0A6A7BDC8_9PLEO|nr:hypothetical protein T440DRAFT_392489 [Plenodomus tracheiphilus IPT5]
MTSNAIIVFSQAGVRPPVYVTTSLSGWTILEMDAEKAQEDSEELVFKKEFVDIAEGSHQYKIRIGQDHWVLDESTESVPDEHGNLNNVVHIKAETAPSTIVSSEASNTETVSSTSEPKTSLAPVHDREESSMDVEDPRQLPTIPIPFVVVEKVEDKEHLPYGDLEPVPLPTDASKRAADAEPDFEEVKADSPVDPPMLKSPVVPLLVVEKTDDQPAHGDDFGEDATSAQKLAHKQRAADASPDRFVISAENPSSPTPGDDDAAPLSRHESSQADELTKAPSIDSIEEESAQSSTDQTSSGDIIHTPSDPDESQDNGESSGESLLSHELGSASQDSKHQDESDQGDTKKLDEAPLFSHETEVDDDRSLSDEDELDKAPLLSHETGFSDYKRSETITNSEFDEDDEENMEPQHHGPYENDDDVPLLPHERVSAVVSKTDFEDDEHFNLDKQPTFGYESDSPHPLFGGNVRPNYFRTRTNSSTLPHKLPRTDEDDDNLDDPSLEQFPTNRDQILERVKTIGLHLPEDEPVDNHIHSPQFSVLSQACSSAELAPVKSYTSLASVPEADNSDEEQEDDDVESLASPIMIGGASTRPFDRPSDAPLDAPKTPAAEESKQLQLPKISEPETASVRTAVSSEADSVGKHDGAKDTSSITAKLQDYIHLPVLPSKVLDTVAPSSPLEHIATTTVTNTNNIPHDSEVREHRKAPDTNTSTQDAQPNANTEEPNGTVVPTPAPAQQLAQQRHDSSFQNLIRIIAGSIGRFITACAGDRKKAR